MLTVRTRIAISLLLIFTVTIGCDRAERIDPSDEPATTAFMIERPPATLSQTDARIFATNVSEDLILKLTPTLQAIANRIQNSETNYSEFFSSDATYIGLAKIDLETAIAKSTKSNDKNDLEPFLTLVPWPLEQESETQKAENLWAPLIKTAGVKFENASFGIVSGRLKKEADILEMETSFEGRFRDGSGRIYSAKASQTIHWIPFDNGDWKISSWKQHSFEVGSSAKTLFENVTEKVTNAELFGLLTRSIHSETLVERLRPNTKVRIENPIRRQMPDWESSFQYTSASVVDFDRDNWDDLLILDRYVDPVLLRNKGDGTFENIAKQTGLTGKSFTGNCSLFFDFDNDGDSDLFIGRSFDPCLFFRNEEGRLVEDDTINRLLETVSFVTSASVADINRDGLLDLYLCTYSAGGMQPQELAKHVVEEEDRLQLELLIKRNNAFIDRGGPPNIVLINQGGNFEKAKIDEVSKQWRHTFASVWNDIDDDGDQDLYVCNDFAPDVFLRNETERGSTEIKFSDATSEMIGDGVTGFGMGANFGDFNSDGLLDLYVSNMYSKAGNRVFAELGSDFDPKIVMSARGNFLYQRDQGKFVQVAGTGYDQQHVAKVGWSFGGQFADFTNDGHLDLYVPSGYYSAPKTVDTQVDL